MTIRQYLHGYMSERLIPYDVAVEILMQLEAEEQRHMDDQIDGYPKAYIAALVSVVNGLALEWIDANKPSHLCRSMFA